MNRRLFAAGAALIALQAATSAAVAQTEPPRSPALTVPDVAPPAPPQAPPPPLVSAPAMAPAEAASIRLTPARIMVEGGLPALADQERAIVAPLEGREIAAAQLFEAATRIESAYVAAGYVLVRAVVPPQDLARDGATVRIAVIGGTVSGIDVSGLPRRVQAVVARLVSGLEGRAWPTRGEIERALLLAGDAASIGVSTLIEPGDTPGTVRLRLAGRGSPFSLQLGFDNAVGGSLGGSALTLSPALRSALGLGETIYGIVGGAPFDGWIGDKSPRRFAALGLAAPIGTDGLRLSIEGLIAWTRPDVPATVLATRSRYVRAGMKLSYPLIRSRARDLFVEFGLDLVDERQIARDFGVPLYHDRLRPLRLGVRYLTRAPGETLSLSAELSQGIAGLGARGRNDATPAAPLSRLGGDADFTKIGGRMVHLAALGGGFSYAFNLEGQASLGGPLFNSEQFAIGGPRALSGYDLGSLAGDDAAVARVELRHGTDFGPGGTIEPYGFAAAGIVHRRQATVLESATVHAGSIGAGARLTVSAAGRPLRLEGEVARGFGDRIPGNWRFNIGAIFGF